MLKFIQKHKLLTSSVLTIAVILGMLGVQLNVAPTPSNHQSYPQSFTLTIGTVDASQTVDYICDGIADDIQFQGAIDALPAGGGEIHVLTGNYVFSATVTRAIANVTITGVGKATYIAHDAGTALFTAGGNNWVYSNFRVDTTTAQLVTAMAATTLWSWENITTSDGQFAYKTDDATTGANWAIPTGRAATYVIAASDAPANVKAQADYPMPNAGADVGAIVNAAIASGYYSINLSQGTFKNSTTLVMSVDGISFSGQGNTTILTPSADVDVISVTADYVHLSNFKIEGDKGARASGDGISLETTSRFIDLSLITVRNIKDIGIFSDGCTDVKMDFIHCELNGKGMKIKNGGGGSFSNMILNTNDAEGLNLEGATWLLFNGTRVWGNIGNGIIISPSSTMDSYDIHFVGGDVDGNKLNGILLYNPALNALGIYNTQFNQVQFGDNSLTNGNTYDDIKFTRDGTGGVSGLWITKCEFPGQSYTKYRINFNNSPVGISNVFINNCTFALSIGGTGKIFADASTAGLHIKDNIGYTTETTIYSANFAIDSTGNKTTSTLHLLDMTPAMSEVQVTISMVTGVTDWSIGHVFIYQTTSTVIDVWVTIDVASATAGAVAKFSITVTKP